MVSMTKVETLERDIKPPRVVPILPEEDGIDIEAINLRRKPERECPFHSPRSYD